VAQNGFVNLPTQLKTDSGFYGNGFYFTRYPRCISVVKVVKIVSADQPSNHPNARTCRYSDYYISGCKQFARTGDVGASFLMSFVACGRPYPVTKGPQKSNPLPLSGQPCSAQSPCGGGPGRHDSHYVCVKFNGEYFPCPAREQPDYDEIVAFNSAAVLPVAAFEFKRRRRTLLWLNDHPQNDFLTLRLFPGCPESPAALHVEAYPMRQHCAICKHGLTMDSNPSATVKERQKIVMATERERDNALNSARAGNPDAKARLQSCIDALRLAEAALASAEAAVAAIQGEFEGRDIKMYEQTDVVLFTSVDDMTRFLRAHPELSKCRSPLPFLCSRACLWFWLHLLSKCRYPSSLLRIISNHRLMHEGGLLDFFDSDVAWRHKYTEGLRLFVLCSICMHLTRMLFRYPATLMFDPHSVADTRASRVRLRPSFKHDSHSPHAVADTSRLRFRPSFFTSSRQQSLVAFATFKSLALLPSSSSS